MAAEEASLPAMNSGLSADIFNYIDATGALRVTVRQPEQAVFVIEVAGELDMLTQPPLEARLATLLNFRPDRLIIDLSQITFLGSTGLTVLLDAREAAARQDTVLQLSGADHRAVSRPLGITGLAQLFETAPLAGGPDA
jgi:anti-sigma B factor antagonist